MTATDPITQRPMSWLNKCKTADCSRRTTANHCCTPCADAREFGHEIHEHSDGCNDRHAQRAAAQEG